MPQAVKHFNATLTNSTTGTVYTCPSNTIAIVIPTITVNHSANSVQTTFSWNSSTAAGDYTGNLCFYYYNGTNDQAHVSPIDKYNVLVTVPDGNSATAITYFSASHTSGLNSTNVASSFGNGLSDDTNPISPIGSNRTSSFVPSTHSTGPWVMSAGHVLSYYLNGNQSTTYNFLILEEAA